MQLEKADEIYERIKGDLEKQYKGRIVAVEIESGEYFIGDTVLQAYNKGIEKHPGKTFVYKRVGFSAVHFVGAF
ncbi:hypothetical protein HY605_05935 [Candidatus Peregrinibacteria bacterium]|nr:hypothetical protein [Candidatus Peregrinibacteria bacterium]